MKEEFSMFKVQSLKNKRNVGYMTVFLGKLFMLVGCLIISSQKYFVDKQETILLEEFPFPGKTK